MDFLKALSQSMQMRKAKVNRKQGTRAYYCAGAITFSRLMGYKLIGDRYEPDPRYAPAIKNIFEMLSCGATLPEVRQKLFDIKARDSSNNRYSFARIMALVRPIYAGFLDSRGKTPIKNLTPIVTLEIYRKAERQLRIERKKLVDQ